MAIKEVVTIAENNIEVREYIVDKATDEKFYLRDKQQSYGETRLNSELAAVDDHIKHWTELDVERHRKEQLDALKVKRDLLLEVQTALEAAKPKE